MSMVGFPLLLIPLAIYNIIVFLMPGVSFATPLFTLALMSGIAWPVTLSDVLIALGNSGDVSLAHEAERLLDDASPLVRGAAVWALGKLDKLALQKRSYEHEMDESVREEWAAALSLLSSRASAARPGTHTPQQN